jgi:V/A-type H+-transporting ATPase subunit I
MARLDAVLPKKSLRAALERLGAGGRAELLPAAAAEPGEAAALLGRAAALRRELGLGAPGPAPAMDAAEARAELERLSGRASELLGRVRELSATHARLAAESARLSYYSGLGLPASGGPLLSVACGSVPSEKAASLRALLPRGAAAALLAEEKGFTLLAAAALPSAAPAMELALKAAGFRAEELPPGEGLSLGALAARAAARERQASEDLRKAREEAAGLAAEADVPLASVMAALSRESALASAEGSARATASAAVVSAWVPAASASAAARELGESAGGACAAELRPPEPGEDVPVLLEPPRLLRPFAMLVAAYGLPRYGEVEPTVFAAGAFLLMFGMMFGDAGHGAVTAAAGLALARYGRGTARDAGRVMAWCGLSAALFGLLYGSFFGLEGFRRFALWRDPLEGDPVLLVKAAAAFGAAVISLGVALNTVNRFRAGDLPGALCGKFGAAGLLFYWSGLLWISGLIGWRAALWPMGAAVLCWALLEPAEALFRRGGRDLGAAAAEGAVGAFEGALLYLANTVSFVRLAAYAMSHAALLAAAYALQGAADAVWGSGSAAGIAAAVLGNAAAIGLEGLVACVQALRLEYYEFFGKFLEGEGRPFRPFTLQIKGGS